MAPSLTFRVACRSFAAHPGLASTNLFGHFGGFEGAVTNLFAQDAEHGALPTLYAATQDLPGASYVGPDGFQQLWGYPTIVRPSKLARNTGVGKRLWELSAKLTATWSVVI